MQLVPKNSTLNLSKMEYKTCDITHSQEEKEAYWVTTAVQDTMNPSWFYVYYT
jgi:hypothetical protein